jgi:hypothetical protein
MNPSVSSGRKFRRYLPLPFLGALALAGPLTTARAADAAAADGSSPTAPAATMAQTAPMPKPELPMDFKDFASDYKSTTLYPEWLNVEVAVMESTAAPLPNMPTGSIPEDKWTQQMEVDFKPITMTCVIGAKTRYDNVMMLDADKAGHPLGYSLPLGQIIYFLARSETPDGIYFSVHVYDASQVNWVANPTSAGAYFPVTKATVVSRDVIARPNTYSYFLLSTRTAPQRPDVPIRPATLYTYLVVHIHRLDEAPVAQPTGIIVPSGGPASTPSS